MGVLSQLPEPTENPSISRLSFQDFISLEPENHRNPFADSPFKGRYLNLCARLSGFERFYGSLNHFLVGRKLRADLAESAVFTVGLMPIYQPR